MDRRRKNPAGRPAGRVQLLHGQTPLRLRPCGDFAGAGSRRASYGRSQDGRYTHGTAGAQLPYGDPYADCTVTVRRRYRGSTASLRGSGFCTYSFSFLCFPVSVKTGGNNLNFEYRDGWLSVKVPSSEPVEIIVELLNQIKPLPALRLEDTKKSYDGFKTKKSHSWRLVPINLF